MMPDIPAEKGKEPVDVPTEKDNVESASCSEDEDEDEVEPKMSTKKPVIRVRRKGDIPMKFGPPKGKPKKKSPAASRMRDVGPSTSETSVEVVLQKVKPKPRPTYKLKASQADESQGSTGVNLKLVTYTICSVWL